MTEQEGLRLVYADFNKAMAQSKKHWDRAEYLYDQGDIQESLSEYLKAFEFCREAYDKSPPHEVMPLSSRNAGFRSSSQEVINHRVKFLFRLGTFVYSLLNCYDENGKDQYKCVFLYRDLRDIFQLLDQYKDSMEIEDFQSYKSASKRANDIVDYCQKNNLLEKLEQGQFNEYIDAELKNFYRNFNQVCKHSDLPKRKIPQKPNEAKFNYKPSIICTAIAFLVALIISKSFIAALIAGGICGYIVIWTMRESEYF